MKKEINLLKTLYFKSCKMVDGRLAGGFIDDKKDVNIAINKAIEALEKQMPKKPIKDRDQNIRYTTAYSCPSCGGGFTGTGIANNCYHCGQKLDWSEVEE